MPSQQQSRAPLAEHLDTLMSQWQVDIVYKSSRSMSQEEMLSSYISVGKSNDKNDKQWFNIETDVGT